MKDFKKGVSIVLESPKRIWAIIILSLIFYSLIITLENISYLKSSIHFSLSVSEKIGLYFSFIFSPLTTFSPTSFVFTSIAIILFATQLVMFWYWVTVRRNAFEGNSAALSFGGSLAAILGIGCASCGSLLLTSVAASTGIAVESFLPFGGTEISVLACALLFVAVYQLGKKISTPFVC